MCGVGEGVSAGLRRAGKAIQEVDRGDVDLVLCVRGVAGREACAVASVCGDKGYLHASPRSGSSTRASAW